MNNWVDWPKAPGFYWFYGYVDFKQSRRFDENARPELMLVSVHYGAKRQIIVHRWAEFVYPSHAKGKFLFLDRPELPSIGE